MQSDAELNRLVATGIMHWKEKGDSFVNSQGEVKCKISDYQPVTNAKQLAEVIGKMKARDYQCVLPNQTNAAGQYEASLSKYGETFSGQASTAERAATIAILKAYQLLQ